VLLLLEALLIFACISTSGKVSSLAKIPEKDINAEMVFKHAAEGDNLCQRLVDEVRKLRYFLSQASVRLTYYGMKQAAEYLGFACVNYARMMDPEVRSVLLLRESHAACVVNLMRTRRQIIVLSGGLAEAGETYIEQIRRAYAKHTWTFPDPVRVSADKTPLLDPTFTIVCPWSRRLASRRPPLGMIRVLSVPSRCAGANSLSRKTSLAIHERVMLISIF
jgi:predicted NBD/HSP70 family sugar kinase